MNQSSENAQGRFRALPAAGLVSLLAGAALIAAGLIADSSIIAYSGWLVLAASALLIVIGMIARSAEKSGRREDGTDRS